MIILKQHNPSKHETIRLVQYPDNQFRLEYLGRNKTIRTKNFTNKETALMLYEATKEH